MKMGAGNVLEQKQTPDPMPEDGFNQDWCLSTPKVGVKFPTEPCTPEMPDLSSVTQDIFKVSHYSLAMPKWLYCKLEFYVKENISDMVNFFFSPSFSSWLRANLKRSLLDLCCRPQRPAFKKWNQEETDCSHNAMSLLIYFLMSAKHFKFFFQ